MMRTVLHVEAGELEIVVDTSIHEMAQRGDGICDFEDPNSSPQLVSLVHGESWNASALIRVRGS